MLPLATATNLIGYLGCGVCAAMFGGPLASMTAVLRDRSAASIPIGFTLFSTVNTSVWLGYGPRIPISHHLAPSRTISHHPAPSRTIPHHPAPSRTTPCTLSASRARCGLRAGRARRPLHLGAQRPRPRLVSHADGPDRAIRHRPAAGRPTARGLCKGRRGLSDRSGEHSHRQAHA
jgi:hypothetical protein